jgi:hypothetical protein
MNREIAKGLSPALRDVLEPLSHHFDPLFIGVFDSQRGFGYHPTPDGKKAAN